MIVRLDVREAEICFDPDTGKFFAAIPDNSHEGNEFRAVIDPVSVPTDRRDEDAQR